jgi:hypothetical protein
MRAISLQPLSCRYLSLSEREEIASVREIARQVKRSPSTVSRELRRSAATRTDPSGYRASEETQGRSRELQLHARVRAPQPTPPGDQGTSPTRRRRVHRSLQHHPAPQLVRDEVTHRLRGDPRATSSEDGRRGASGVKPSSKNAHRARNGIVWTWVRTDDRLNQLNESLHDSGGSPPQVFRSNPCRLPVTWDH